MREAVFKAAVAPAQQRFGQDHGADVMQHGEARTIGKLPTDQTRAAIQAETGEQHRGADRHAQQQRAAGSAACGRALAGKAPQQQRRRQGAAQPGGA